MTAPGEVVIAGSIAQKPRHAGHTWQFLQYLLGFRALGWRVLFLDRLEAGMCVDAEGRPAAPEDSHNAAYLAGLMESVGLEADWSVALGDGRHLGLPRERVLERLGGADLLINVMGFLTDEELLGAARRRVFLDTDPGFGQMWSALGLADIFAGHDDHVTIGERIGRPDCAIPTCGLDWITTPQPVALDAWPVAPDPPTRPFTTVASWRGAYGPIDFEGHRYGLRVHEFRRFAELPRRTGEAFELALAIDPGETDDLALLRGGGWTLADPLEVASTPEGYREYVQQSCAELMIAKGIYVDARSGWFSERSLCYLASGRPVVAQDTGLADVMPVGEGCLTFSTLDEAAAAVAEVRSDYARHARAARELAESRFDASLVLGKLLDALAARA